MAALSAAMLLPPATAAASQPEQQQQQQQGNRSRQQQQERQQELWEDLFSNPSQWWDNRPNKRNPTYPDFRHKASKQPLWVDNRHKPPWVESRLPTLYGHHHDLDYDVSDAPSTQQHLQKESGHSSPTFLSSDDDLVRNLCDRGQLNMAIDVLSSMHTALSSSTYKSLLQACTKRKALDHAKQVQAHIALHKPAELIGIVGDNLVVTFAKCGAIEDARQISTTLRHRSVVSWTAMISACVECGNAQEALKMHQCMQDDNVEPNSYTYVSLFKACSIVQDLELGRKLHADARKKGLASGFFVGSALVSMYSKGGAIVEAEDVFSELFERDIVSWTAMLSAYIEQGQAEKTLQLYRQMQDEGLRVDRMVFVIALQACTTVAEKEDALLVDGEPIKLMSLEIGQALHADAHKKDFASHCFVGTTLLSMYGKCGAITEAEAVFGAISQRDLVSWRAMLSAYVELGQGEKALQLYRQMQENGMSADQLTYVIALQACAILGEKEEAVVLEGKSANVVALEIGRALLADVHMSYFALDTFIGTAQLTMYAKCGTLAEAEDVFCALSHRDVVSWTAMISSYMEQGQVEKALQLYSLMQKEGVSPDKLTFVIVLQACATFSEKEEAFLAEGRSIKIKALEIGQALLADASMKGFASDVGVGTALLSMYGKCGVIMEAEDVFGKLSHRSVVSWNAMLLAYVEHSQGEKAFDLYRRMKKSRVIMNDATFICLLQACHETGSLELCKQVHFDIVSAGYDWMASVITTLIHAYGSCASMADAQGIFDELPEHERDVVSWNAYIAGLSGDGNIGETLHMFEKMKGAGIKPNEATFNAVLLACCRAGFVAKGVEYFESMSRDYDITPDLKHYGIMLDLLGRAGDFKRIEKMLERMPMQAPLTMWLSLLGACRMHGNVELAKQVFDHAVNLQPKQAAAYVLMSNIYAEAGLQQCAAEVEHFRHKNCVEKAWPELVG